MSDTPQIAIYDATTDTLEIRNVTSEELENLQSIENQVASQQAELDAKADARESALAKLAALGLTQDEINAL